MKVQRKKNVEVGEPWLDVIRIRRRSSNKRVRQMLLRQTRQQRIKMMRLKMVVTVKLMLIQQQLPFNQSLK